MKYRSLHKPHARLTSPSLFQSLCELFSGRLVKRQNELIREQEAIHDRLDNIADESYSLKSALERQELIIAQLKQQIHEKESEANVSKKAKTNKERSDGKVSEAETKTTRKSSHSRVSGSNRHSDSTESVDVIGLNNPLIFTAIASHSSVNGCASSNGYESGSSSCDSSSTTSSGAGCD